MIGRQELFEITRCFFIIIWMMKVSYQSEAVRFVQMGEKHLSWQEATKACSNIGKDWYLPDGNTHQDRLYNFMFNNSLSSVWLSLKKNVYNDWKWINHQTISSENIITDPGSMCAGITAQGNIIHSMQCARQNGFICQMPGNHPCPVKRYLFACVELNNTMYVIGCNADNFYNSRTHCRQLGGDMAVLNSPGKISSIRNSVIEKKLFNYCSWYFVGLRKEDWLSTSSPNNSYPSQFYWDRGEPRFGSGDCCTIERRDDTFFWQTAACGNGQKVVCQNYAEEMALNSTSVIKKEFVRLYREDKRTVILLSTFATLVTLCLTATILWIVVTKSQRRKKKKGAESNNSPEGDKLMSAENTIPSQFEGITIGVFSSKIEKSCDKFQNVKICDLSDSEDKTDTGTKLAVMILSAFIKIPKASEKDICIINYGVAKKEDWSILVNSKSLGILPDVLLLDGIGPQGNLQLLRNVRDLKNRCVCISPAKSHNMEMTASETIAVGDWKFMKETIKSGLLDFIHEGANGEEKTLEEGVASLVGMVAGILWNMKKEAIRFQGIRSVCQTAAMRNMLANILAVDNSESQVGYGNISLPAIESALSTKDLFSMVEDACTERRCYKTSLREQQLLKRSEPHYNHKHIGESEKPLIKVASILGTADITPAGACEILKKLFDEKYTQEYILDKTAYSRRITFPDKLICGDWIKVNDNEDRTSIVFFISEDLPSEGKQNFYDKLETFKKKNIVITNAKALNGHTTPLVYPGDSVITVKDTSCEECGSTLDFTVSTDKKQNWEAAVQTCAVVAMILLKFKTIVRFHEGYELSKVDFQERYERLRSTSVMRRILIDMCTHPEYHSLEDGYGELQPWKVLKDSRIFDNIVFYHTDDQVTDYWRGKTLELDCRQSVYTNHKIEMGASNAKHAPTSNEERGAYYY